MIRIFTTLVLALSVAALSVSSCRVGERKMFEASMNFDLENVEPFLNQLEKELQLGLPVGDLVAFTRSTAVEEEKARTVSVKFKGAATTLEYRVSMDDIDAPDLYFNTNSEELASAINLQLQKFATERGL